jgi:hypothetical protein
MAELRLLSRAQGYPVRHLIDAGKFSFTSRVLRPKFVAFFLVVS